MGPRAQAGPGGARGPSAIIWWIVVAAIGLLGAAGVTLYLSPNLQWWRISVKPVEAAASEELRQVFMSQSIYFDANPSHNDPPRYAGTFRDLIDPNGDGERGDGVFMMGLDQIDAEGVLRFSGYRFRIFPALAPDGSPMPFTEGWAAEAVPDEQVLSHRDFTHFYVDQTGALRFSEGSPAGPQSQIRMRLR